MDFSDWWLRHLLWSCPNMTDDQSTLVQVMAWCHQATSHYLSQCWPRSLTPYGITRPQWVKLVIFKIKDSSEELFPWNCSNLNATRPHWLIINIGSGKVLVPSGNRPLCEPVLTLTFVAIRCYQAIMSWYHLKLSFTWHAQNLWCMNYLVKKKYWFK